MNKEAQKSFPPSLGLNPETEQNFHVLALPGQAIEKEKKTLFSQSVSISSSRFRFF
jgi:hypothetical protein